MKATPTHQRNTRARRLLMLALLVLVFVLLSLGLTGQTQHLFQNFLPAASLTAENSPAIASPTAPAATPTATPTLPAATPTSLPILATLPSSVESNASTWGDSLKQGMLILSIHEGRYSHLYAYHPQKLPFTRLVSGNWNDITPAISPDGKWLAFASNRTGFYDLYLLDLTSGQLLQVTNTPEYDASPSWSPDGRWLAYESYQASAADGQGNLELFIRELVMEALTSQTAIQLTNHPAADFSPAWSPDGRKIAFVSHRAGEKDLWLADLDRMDDRFQNLTAHLSSPADHPAWSPDGQSLLFSASYDNQASL